MSKFTNAWTLLCFLVKCIILVLLGVCYILQDINHIYLKSPVVLKRPGFQSQKYGMPTFGELWADAWVALLWYLFFRVLRHNAGGWSCAQTLPLCAPAIVVTESDISKKSMLSFLQVSCSSNESVVQQERRNCIVSSICLLVLFDGSICLSVQFACRFACLSVQFAFQFA